MERRRFLSLLAGGAAAGALMQRASARAAERKRIRAAAFDAFPIFDPRPVFARAEQLFPGRGGELSNAWRTRQFEYQWLRALGGHYVNFQQATEDALVFAARMLKLDLTTDKRRQLMEAYFELEVWPDVPGALESLKKAGIRLGFLSNATPKILHAGIKKAGLEQTFEHVLSTDKLRTYKPDPRAYQLGPETFGLAREEIVFVAFAGWDVAGAKWFGYPTFWVNRLGLPAEELGVAPDGMGQTMTDLVAFVRAAG